MRRDDNRMSDGRELALILSPNQLALQSAAKDLAEAEFRPRAADVDQSEAYPWDSVTKLAEAGFMGMTIPKAYGGRGLSYLDAVVVIEQIARCCATLGRVTVEANMGAIGAIMAYGTEPQKRLVAPYVYWTATNPRFALPNPKPAAPPPR